jgi:putative FmdB family regulatory protein
LRRPRERGSPLPTYDYRCAECGHRFELVQSFSDAAVTDCPECAAKGSVRKVYGNVGVVLKGSGFYRNDSRGRSSSVDTKGSEKSGSEKSGSDKSGSEKSGSEKSSSDKSGSDKSGGSSGSDSSKGSGSSGGKSSGGSSKAAAAS